MTMEFFLWMVFNCLGVWCTQRLYEEPQFGKRIVFYVLCTAEFLLAQAMGIIYLLGQIGL